jgi:hypothetical protein
MATILNSFSLLDLKMLVFFLKYQRFDPFLSKFLAMFRVKKRQFFAVFLNFNTDPG